MGKSLIIVESPAKTKTYKNFLGNDFLVEASMGHVRDLPTREIGVDVQNGFEPKYVTIRERSDVLKRLSSAAKKADVVYLASDPDREGEAIAWHLAQALKLKEPRRIHVNEITRAAVSAALANPGTINQNLVEAQEARRILDRLVGYRLSPLLWKKVQKNLSAGRVQSVVVRLICDREREIQAFVSEEYWSITALLTPQPPAERFPFEAKLVGRLPDTPDLPLNRDGSPRLEKVNLGNEAEAQAVLNALGHNTEHPAAFRVRSITKQTKRRAPAPPFITSTLQQEASRKLGFNNRRTMSVAQSLYEGVDIGAEGPVGLITYMRTDSTRMAREAQEEIREHIRGNFGEQYVPAKPPSYASRAGAQDAHEAIRPTSVERTPEMLADKLTPEQLKLYRLIWQRAVASQMVNAVFDVTRADIQAADFVFRATGSVMKFDGFLRVYREGRDTEQEEDEDRAPLPHLEANQDLELIELQPKQHFTEPPPRYTEATLVKAMEEKGIGRPSTYASIIATIQDREYVKQVDKRFYPTELGMAVTDLLVKHFPEVMDVGFTAEMENRLDEVEQGQRQKVALLSEFYGPFERALDAAHSQMESLKPAAVQTEHLCPNCGKPMMLRQSRRGPFLGCSGYPKCRTVLNIGEDGAPLPEESRPQPEVTDQLCPKCGKPLVKRTGKLGPFLGCSGYPKCKTIVNLPSAEGEPSEQSAEQPTEAQQPCPKCGRPLVERVGRYGKFLGCSGYPECRTIVRPGKSESGAEEASGVGAGGQDGAAAEYPPCPNCGRPLVRRNGKRGPFLGCSGYPKCKTIVNLDEIEANTSTAEATPAIPGVQCPKDGGALVERTSRAGRAFVGCANYPDCDFTTSLQLTGEICPQCGWPTGTRRGRGASADTVQCSNPGCDYRG
jgi:DNA topoisomerase-1